METAFSPPAALSSLKESTSNNFAHHPRRAAAWSVCAAIALSGVATSAKSPSSLVEVRLPTADPSPGQKHLSRLKAAKSSGLQQLQSRLRAIGAYEAGDLGPESKPASASSLLESGRFVEQIDWTTSKIPSLNLAEDGEINFFWSDPELYLDLGFYGDGTYSYYAKTRTDRKSVV